RGPEVHDQRPALQLIRPQDLAELAAVALVEGQLEGRSRPADERRGDVPVRLAAQETEGEQPAEGGYHDDGDDDPARLHLTPPSPLRPARWPGRARGAWRRQGRRRCRARGSPRPPRSR